MWQVRLHKSSILLGILAAVIFVLICVPGRVYDRYPGTSTSYEHGWPYAYLRRQTLEASVFAVTRVATLRDSLQTLPVGGIPWLSADNWKFWQAQNYPQHSLWSFNRGAFAADCMVLTAILLLIVVAAEYRRRGRASVFSISLAETFVIFTLVCMALGWVVHVRDGYPRELAVESTLDGEGGPSVMRVGCVAPVWVSALIGNCWMPAYMWRVSEVVSTQEVAKVPGLCNDIRALPYSKKLVLSGSVFGGDHFPYAMLCSVPELETIVLSAVPRMDTHDVQELSQLSGLKKIVCGKNEVDRNLIHQLEAGLPGCEIADYEEGW